MFYTVILNDAQAVFAYPTLTAAIEKFHTELAYALNQGNACTCIVIDRDGAIYRSEKVKATA